MSRSALGFLMKRPTTDPTRSSNKVSMEALIKSASRVRVSRGNIASQRQSFAIGSAALENSILNRSSIVELANETPGNFAEIEVANLVGLYDFVIAAASTALESPDKRLLFSPALIKVAHKIGLAGLRPDAGDYRKTAIIVMGSGHTSAPAEEVSPLVEQLCEYINNHWSEASAFHLAAYTLWRLLWIHPFSDGNGRVARALCYLVLSVRLGAILPGTPTLPALIAQQRDRYYAALEEADKAEQAGEINVAPLEELIAELLELQIKNIAAIPNATRESINTTIRDRILRASARTRSILYNTTDPRWQLWSHGSYLTLQIDSDDELQFASERQELFGDPFPNLLSQIKTDASKALPEDRTVHFLEGNKLTAQEGYALYLPPDAGLILASSSCEAGSNRYSIPGTLYCMRFGPRTTVESCNELLDLLIARHIRIKS